MPRSKLEKVAGRYGRLVGATVALQIHEKRVLKRLLVKQGESDLSLS